MHTLVLGIGNTLLSDEGVGVHSIYFLKEKWRDALQRFPHVRLIDGGTLSFTLAAEIESADNLIVIDAAELQASPGTVKTFVNEAMDQYLNHGKQRSVHEVSLLDLLCISRLSGHLPQRRALIGIQPKSLDWGDNPTHEVAAAIPVACRHALAQLKSWLP